MLEESPLISPAQLLFQLPGVALEGAGHGSTPYSLESRTRLVYSSPKHRILGVYLQTLPGLTHRCLCFSEFGFCLSISTLSLRWSPAFSRWHREFHRPKDGRGKSSLHLIHIATF